MKKASMWGLKWGFGIKVLLILSLLILATQSIHAQDSLASRKKLVSYGALASYSTALVGLNQLWYKDYPQSTFHFFNDNEQWLQIDKVGHAYSTYVLGKASAATFKWAGYSQKQSALYGSGGAFLFLTTVEIFDAYSQNWGFSWGDFAANTLGNGLYLGQELAWQEQVMLLKFSYSPSIYREQRPNLLGDSELQGVLKDYNGQTYWASFNLNSLASSIKPKWLNLAVGMGGEQMLFARNSEQLGLNHQRQWYLSPDIDFERIPTKKKWLKVAFSLINCLKMPLPALELQNGKNLNFKWIHY
ncbi:MAG: DUF2279 domain-containing protein [Vicingaceae bacterium]